MKNIIRQWFAFLLALTTLTWMLPMVSYAADNELVLTKIGHTSSDTVSLTNPATRSVTLTVPFSYAGNTLELSAGLIVDKSASVDSVITSFVSGSAAIVGEPGTAGAPVSMTVTYYKGGNTSAPYTTVYSISVARAAKRNPTFTGTITKAVTDAMPNTKTNDITFASGDFLKLYTANDGGALTGISISGSSLSCGSLKLISGSSYTTYVSGRPIDIKDIGNLVFDATGSGTVSYIVSAYAGGDTSIAIGSVVLTIAVNAVTAPTISGALTKSVNAGSTVTFSLNDFSSLYDLHNGKLNTIEIMPASTGSGTWSSGGMPFTGAASFTSSTIGNLKFTGNTAGSASFTWRVSNEAGFSASGSGVVTVKTAAAPTIISSVIKSANLGATLTFSLNDFSSLYNINNGTLKNIVITPSTSSFGVWYKGSDAFSGAKTFDANDIGTLKFKGTLCGQAAFTWTVSNEKGTSSPGNGAITVTAVATTINYTTGLNTAKTFSAADFNAASKDATGASLHHISFSLPPVSCGTLYYGYASPSSPGTAIAANAVLYYGESPKIANVAFVPAANYSGSFTFSYTGVNTNGVSYTGNIRMIVGNAGDVAYFTPQNTARTFNAFDFSTACANMTSAGLSYVYFTAPSSSYGTLFYGYSSSSNPGTAVTSNSLYALQNLSYITFVPAANYTGVLSIPYTGVSASGVSYTGYIKMTVGSPSISYTTSINTAKAFLASDFNTACVNTIGSALSNIILTPPQPAYGTLYYNNASSSGSGTVITAGTNLFVNDSPNISSVTFAPAANYTGSVTIAYTGYAVNGTSYTGSVVIQVTNKTGSSYFTDVGQSFSWAAGAIDFLFEAHIVKGTGSNSYSPAANITRGDFILMLYNTMHFSGSKSSNFPDVPKSSYYYDAIAIAKSLGIAQGYNNKFNPAAPLTRQDAMLLIYKALQVTGEALSDGSSSDISSFTDKGTISSYALTAVKTLVKAGLITGSNSKINPTGNLSRAEMAVILFKIKITF